MVDLLRALEMVRIRPIPSWSPRLPGGRRSLLTLDHRGGVGDDRHDDRAEYDEAVAARGRGRRRVGPSLAGRGLFASAATPPVAGADVGAGRGGRDDMRN